MNMWLRNSKRLMPLYNNRICIVLYCIIIPTAADLKDRLDEYVATFGNLVKLHRNTERLGLIKTRSKGAALSSGDAIVFLDAHCECGKNWLVPLLDRIRVNP